MTINTFLLENLSKSESPILIYDDENCEYKISVFDVSSETVAEYELMGCEFNAQEFAKKYEVFLVEVGTGFQRGYASFNFLGKLIEEVDSHSHRSPDFDWLTLSGIKNGEYGTVEFEGDLYILEEQPYVSNHGTDGGVAYYANATKVGEPLDDVFGDLERKKYLVAWLTTDDYDAACAITPKEEELDRLINKQARGERLKWDEVENLNSLPSEISALREEYGVENEVLMEPLEENACNWDNPEGVKPV